MISFIIPTLNEEKVIEKLLKNISSYQGVKEIIISDGKSTDRTIEIARAYTQHVAIHEGGFRQTIGGGRNAGAHSAQGEYFVFLDADMYIENPTLFFTKVLQAFESDTKLVGMTVTIKVFPEMETLLDKIIYSLISHVYVLQNNILGIGAASGEFQIVRASAFKKIGGYNEHLAVTEDQDLFRRLARIGTTKIDTSLVAYHTGRRAHTVGWPTLLYSWFKNWISVIIFKKSADNEWKEIR